MPIRANKNNGVSKGTIHIRHSLVETPQKTRVILIPQVKYMHAYKMADSREELCFRIENKATYDTASYIIREVDELNEFSRQKCITKLKQIFDKNRKFTTTELQEYQ